MEIQIEVCNQQEMFEHSRSSKAWDKEGMRDYLKDLSEKYPNKIIKLPILEFMKQFRTTEKELKLYYYHIRIMMRNNFKDIFKNPEKQIYSNHKYLFLDFNAVETENDDVDEE